MANFLRPAIALSYNTHRFPNKSLANFRIPASPLFRLYSGANNLILTSFIHNSNCWSGTSRATTPSPPPPPPPEPEPPTGKRLTSPSGVAMTLSRFKDTAHVFVAVLFWMSVFFWASAWDGRDNGRSDKGPRF